MCGVSVLFHREPAEDEEYWRVYITGQYEIARLSAREVAKAVRLGERPAALLDVAGGHGWFSAELCKRHEGLKATVVDLPGSARREALAPCASRSRRASRASGRPDASRRAHALAVPLPGGRGRYIFYSPNDYDVDPSRQVYEGST